MNDELGRTHERIQDLEALIAGRPIPIRGDTSPLRWIVVLLLAIAIGVFFPLRCAPTAIPTKWPAKLPTGALSLADNAAPVFAKSNGKDIALVRGWWRGHEDLPLYLVMLDPTDWTVMGTSDAMPATALDRGGIRVDDSGGVALVYTSMGHDQKQYYAISLDHGVTVGTTPTPANADEGVRDMTTIEKLPHDVPGIGPGSRLGAMTVHGDDVVITANDALFIVDAATWQLKKRIDRF